MAQPLHKLSLLYRPQYSYYLKGMPPPDCKNRIKKIHTNKNNSGLLIKKLPDLVLIICTPKNKEHKNKYKPITEMI